MKTFKLTAAQGEVYVRRLGPISKSQAMKGFKKLAPENGNYIVGHSETGHHHVIGTSGVTLLEKEKVSAGMRILRAIVEKPTALEHLRPFHTHESIALEEGTYEFIIGRENDPFGEIRRQMD